MHDATAQTMSSSANAWDASIQGTVVATHLSSATSISSLARVGDADLELQAAPETILLDVQNMKCGGCTASVKRILEGIPEVSTASVNLLTESAAVTVRGPANDHAPGSPSTSTGQDAATLLSKRVRSSLDTLQALLRALQAYFRQHHLVPGRMGAIEAEIQGLAC